VSEHEHDEHGGHDDPAHGPEPLVGVDATDLHAAVAALAAALHGYVDAVIEPSQTRPEIVKALRLLRTKRGALPPKKHGNNPL